MFSHQIGLKIKVYVNDMIVKTTEGKILAGDLEDVMQPVRKYSMRLNPAKCSFGVQVRKFLGFMLTKRDIKANLDKFQAFITMRSPTNVKEVQ